jgi:hypothetical protein
MSFVLSVVDDFPIDSKMSVDFVNLKHLSAYKRNFSDRLHAKDLIPGNKKCLPLPRTLLSLLPEK